ncbi:MAG: hypothetical protein M3Z26_00385 [Bacteroidota bacterium]|nr:hypothetical protein [Bacteroidota bacterium]
MQAQINLHELANMVQRMRDAQTEYFRHRHKITLQRSIELEKKVDTVLKAIITDTPIINEQQKLFL